MNTNTRIPSDVRGQGLLQH